MLILNPENPKARRFDPAAYGQLNGMITGVHQTRVCSN
jgi:hypothetical protein